MSCGQYAQKKTRAFVGLNIIDYRTKKNEEKT